jgi:formyl-CoA transferase/CoA:oxalate CoA-transferase
MRQVLNGVRVLDLSRWVAGEYATKLFADFGADVIKVEKPGEGSLTRAWGPFPGETPHPERSALFLHLNTNKRSIALDLWKDRDILLALVERADAVVESFRPGHLESLGLGPSVLREINPTLVLTRISAFGQTGPKRDHEATGLVLQAAGGPMSSTGDAHRAPQRKPGLLEHYTIGRSAGSATMAGVFAARRTGTGSVIDVSGQEVLLSGTDRRASFLLAAAYSGANAPRGFPSPHRGKFTFTGKFQAKDGFLMFYVTNIAFWNRLVNLIAEGDTGFEDAFKDRSALGEDAKPFVERLKIWCSTRLKVDIMREGQAAKIPVTAFLSMGELREHPHFRERGFYVSGDHPEAGTLEYLGAPWRMRDGYALRRTAPLLDADRDSILAEVTR